MSHNKINQYYKQLTNKTKFKRRSNNKKVTQNQKIRSKKIKYKVINHNKFKLQQRSKLKIQA